MTTQNPVVTEIKLGKSWLVCWELRGIAERTRADSVTASTTFVCGGKVYKVEFNLFGSTWFGRNLQFNFETKQDDENKSDSMVTVCHKGIRQKGLLRNALQLWWLLDNTQHKSAVSVFQEECPDSICNFQIIIEIPEDEYETKGLKAIQNNFSKLLKKESLADIKFVFKDDQIAAHSAIVAASSPVFAAMFEGGRFKEGQTRTVKIEDIDSRVFRKLLEFLYTGSSGSSKQDPSDVLQALFLAADKYQVDALKEICEEFLICKLEIENLLQNLEWAYLYGTEKLRDAAVAHIVKGQYRVVNFKEWINFSKKYPDFFNLQPNGSLLLSDVSLG